MASDVLTVLGSFVGKIDGKERVFVAGEVIRANDPAVKKWPQFFGEYRFAHETPVEAATAAPGEKRGR